MNSIGNDIVDLNFIDKARTQTKPFYSKILSYKEQRLYQAHFNSIPFWQYVWLLWSCKEAVYKFAKRLQPNLVFSPVKIKLEPELFSEPEFSGFTNAQNLADAYKSYKFINSENPGSNIFCNTIVTQDYIHTIAYTGSDLDHIVSDIKRIDDTDHSVQYAAVRKLLSEKLTAIFPNADLTFGKADAGYPIILNNGVNMDIIASFAHHGNYIGCSYK